MRQLYPQEGDRFVYTIKGGTDFFPVPGEKFKVYTDSSATNLADIQNLSRVTIADSEITVDEGSQLPLFYGPEMHIGSLFVKATNTSSTVGTSIAPVNTFFSGSGTSITTYPFMADLGPTAFGPSSWPGRTFFLTAGSGSANRPGGANGVILSFVTGLFASAFQLYYVGSSDSPVIYHRNYFSPTQWNPWSVLSGTHRSSLVSASRDLAMDDQTLDVNPGSGTTITITIPPVTDGVFRPHFNQRFEIHRLGSGTVNIVPGAGVTITPSTLAAGGSVTATGKSALLRRRGTNSWVITGDVAAI